MHHIAWILFSHALIYNLIFCNRYELQIINSSIYIDDKFETCLPVLELCVWRQISAAVLFRNCTQIFLASSLSTSGRLKSRSCCCCHIFALYTLTNCDFHAIQHGLSSLMRSDVSTIQHMMLETRVNRGDDTTSYVILIHVLRDISRQLSIWISIQFNKI